MTESGDPTEVLRVAIAAANQLAMEEKQSTKDARVSTLPTLSDNVVPHPAAEESRAIKGIQHYFVMAQPSDRRCDPAYGVGLEFPIHPYERG